MTKIDKTVLDWNPRVVPIPSGKKGPVTPRWTETTLRAQDLDGNFLGGETAYGIVLDEDHLVIDVDVHDASKNGWASLEKLSKDLDFDFLEECAFRVDSPSGGAHLYFSKSDEVILPKSLSEYQGLDFLSKGCQVIGPGSTHVDGGEYQVKGEVSCQIEVCEVPLNTLRDLEHKGLAGRVHHNSGPAPAQVVFDADSPIDDFNSTPDGSFAIAKILQSKGYETRLINGEWFEFTRPGKDQAAGGHRISGTIGQSVSRHGNLMLRNFSTNDPSGLPSDRSVTLSEAFRLLNGYSQSELPVRLREAGYGPQDGPCLSTEGLSRSAKEDQAKETLKSSPFKKLREAVRDGVPDQRESVFDGLLRRGEVMNVIAAPKTGKSWFVYGLALAAASDTEFCGFKTNGKHKVLLIDNELHEEELVNRLDRIEGHSEGSFPESFTYLNLRGIGASLPIVDGMLKESGETFDVIILDALYRFIPEGYSENDNAQMVQIYNMLDRIARDNNACIVVVHHTSKGNQSDKEKTDIGAGAGAISRAVDSQLMLLSAKVSGYEGKLTKLSAFCRSFAEPEDRFVERDKHGVWKVHGDNKVIKEAEQVAKNTEQSLSAKGVLDWLENGLEGVRLDISQRAIRNTLAYYASGTLAPNARDVKALSAIYDSGEADEIKIVQQAYLVACMCGFGVTSSRSGQGPGKCGVRVPKGSTKDKFLPKAEVAVDIVCDILENGWDKAKADECVGELEVDPGKIDAGKIWSWLIS